MATTTSPSKLRFIWVLPLLVMAATSIGKLSKAAPLVENFEKLGAVHLMLPLGLVQLTSVVLFLVPKTRRLGFLLLCCYIGGIIATRLLNPVSLGPGIVLGALLWIGMFFEDRTLFLPSPKTS